MKRRLFSALLSICICLTLLPATAFAATIFNKEDIAIINEIIDTHALDWEKAPANGSSVPDDWTYVVCWSDDATNIRVTELNFDELGLTGSLDVSGLTALEELACYDNELTALNVSGCTALYNLECYYNQLSFLDVSDCTALEYLDCSDNQLTALDISDCTALEYLDCSTNQLTGSLDVSGCTALEYLDCYRNQLSCLDVSGCTALNSLDCFNNKLTALDVSSCTALEKLDCLSNLLTTLDVRGLTALEYLDCEENQLTSLHVKGLTKLRFLYCSYNYLTGLDITGINNLQRLWVNYNMMESKNKVTGKTINWDDTYFIFDPQFAQYYNVNYTVEQIGGVSGTKDSTGIKITFDRAVENFTIEAMWADVITGYFKEGELTGAGDTWILEITEVMQEGDFLIGISSFENFRVPADFHIVTVYKAGAEPTTYEVTVNNGTADPEKAAEEATVTITAGEAPAGQRFKNWTVDSGGITLANPNAAATTFIMPARAVEVTANWEDIPVTGVELNKTSTTLTVGNTETLTATVSPANAANKNVNWKSSNQSVATVDDSGKVTAVAPGTAIITVITVSGSKTADCTVTVPSVVEEAVITFDPAGGKWTDGTTTPKLIAANVGDEITIAEAPVREGCEFRYWQGSEYQPGEKYQVPAGGHTFTAVWTESESSDPGETDPDETAPDETDPDENDPDENDSSSQDELDAQIPPELNQDNNIDIEKDKAVYHKGKSLTIDILLQNATVADFDYLAIDGRRIEYNADNCTSHDGNLFVKLTQELLNSLPAGNHNVSIHTKNKGFVTLTIEIREKAASPETGENMGIYLWAGLLLLAAGGLLLSVLCKKRVYKQRD